MRIGQKRAGDAQPLFHAARQAPDFLVSLVRQPDFFQPEVDLGLNVFRGDAVAGGDKFQKLRNGQGVVGGRDIRRESDEAGGILVARADFFAQHFDRSAGDYLQRGDGTQQRPDFFHARWDRSGPRKLRRRTGEN